MEATDNQRYTGICEWFKGQYGFISWKKDGVPQKDLFAHFSYLVTSAEGEDIVAPGVYRTIPKGAKVSFAVGTNFSGKPIAIDIRIEKA